MSVYACSDLHGCLNAYQKIKEYIKPEDIVYCLGDCGDRGPRPWDTIKAVLTDPQFIYLKGNHEDMLVNAVKEAREIEERESYAQRMLSRNGGYETLQGILEEEKVDSWVSMLEKLPLHLTYKNKDGIEVFLCHAGCSFFKDDDKFIPQKEDLLWDRYHYYDTSIHMKDKVIVVHGHTPIEYLAEDIHMAYGPNALCYANGKKYCIDAGAYFNGRAILLNLDSFESIVFNLNE